MDAEQISVGQHSRSRTAFYIVAVLIVAALGFGIWLASQPLNPVTEDELVIWDTGRGNAAWSVYTIDKGKPQALSYEGDGRFSGLKLDGQTFYAAYTLDEEYPQTLLSIDTDYRFALFIGSDLVYTQEPLDADTEITDIRMSGELSGAPSPVVVPLPEGYQGQQMTIVQAQKSVDEDTDGTVYLGPVTLAGQTRYVTGMSSEVLWTTYPAVLLLVLACVLAGAFLFSVYSGKPDASSLYLFLCSLLWMGSVLCSTRTLYVYFGWTGPLQQLFYYDGFAFLFLFLAEQMKRYAKLMYIIAALYAVMFVLGLLSRYVLPPSPMADLLASIPPVLTLPVLAAAIVLAFVEAARGNPTYRLFRKLFLAGAVLYGIVLLVSALRGGIMWTSFVDSLSEGVQSMQFPYVLDVLRYILVAACFVCTAAQFVRLAVRAGADRIMLRERIRMAYQEYLDLERHAKKEASTRDQVRRHLSTADEYIAGGSPDLAQLYLSQTGVALERTTAPVATRNPVVDTILNAKIFEAREAGIDINVQTGHLPRVLPLSSEDLAAVLINTLDNAIAAARRSHEKTMAVKVYMHKGFFCYRCENSMAHLAGDDAGSGYGLQIVEEIADAHDASLVFEQGQHIFVLSLAFPTPSADRRNGWAPSF